MRRLQAARADAAKIVVGVSPVGQHVFDAVAKTYTRTHWDGKTIVVLDEVRLNVTV